MLNASALICIFPADDSSTVAEAASATTNVNRRKLLLVRQNISPSFQRNASASATSTLVLFFAFRCLFAVNRITCFCDIGAAPVPNLQSSKSRPR